MSSNTGKTSWTHTRQFDSAGTKTVTVRVYDQGGNILASSQLSVEVSEATPALPTFNSGVSLRGITNGIGTRWNPASGATRYELYRSTRSGSLGDLIYSGPNTSYEDTGLSSGTTYYYRVKACNSAGCVDGRQDSYTYSVPTPTLPRITRGGESDKLTIGSPSCGSSAHVAARRFADKLDSDGRIYAKTDSSGNVKVYLDYPAFGPATLIRAKLLFTKDNVHRTILSSSSWLTLSRSGGSLSLSPALSDYSDRQYDLAVALKFRNHAASRACAVVNDGYIEIR